MNRFAWENQWSSKLADSYSSIHTLLYRLYIFIPSLHRGFPARSVFIYIIHWMRCVGLGAFCLLRVPPDTYTSVYRTKTLKSFGSLLVQQFYAPWSESTIVYLLFTARGDSSTIFFMIIHHGARLRTILPGHNA